MATTTEPGGKQRNKSRPEKKAQNAQSSAHDKLKTVVRRLPPNLPEDIFWQSVEPWVSDETVSWRAFYPGKIRKKWVYLSLHVGRDSKVCCSVDIMSTKRTSPRALISRFGPWKMSRHSARHMMDISFATRQVGHSYTSL